MATVLEAGAAKPARANRRHIALLVLAHMSNDAYHGFLSPLMPLLARKLELSLSMVGLLSSAHGITADMGQLLFGYFADRLRKGWLMALGPLCGALLAFMFFAPNFWALFGLLLVGGVGSACFHPVATVLANQSAGDRKGLGVSLYISGGRLGMAAGAALATFLATRFGPEGVIFGVIPGLVFGTLLLFLAPPFRGAGGLAHQDLGATLKSLRVVFRPLFRLWVVNLCRTSVTMTVNAFVPLYVVKTGGTVAQGGRTVTFFLLAATVGGIYGGHLSDRLGRRWVTIASLVVGTPLIVLGFLLPDPYRTAALMAAGAAFYAQMGVSVTYAQEIAPAHAALVSSFMLGVMWFAASGSMVVVGALADAFGLAATLPVYCAVVGGVGLALSFGLPRFR
ncbi:MAG: MFS transporter [Nitrospinota bacterium]